MGDVLLSVLNTSVQVQPASTSTSATQQSPQRVPAEILGLPSGNLLKGNIIRRDGDSTPIMRTQYGELRVQSELFLKTGSELVLRVNNQAGEFSARIVSVDNVPLKTLLAQQTQPVTTQDEILQSSLFGNKQTTVSSGIPTTQTTQPATAQTVLLNAALLKPASYGTQQQTVDTIASILRVPTAQAEQIVKGETVQFRVVGGTLSLSQTTPQANPAANATSVQTKPFPGTVQSTPYGAYTKLVQTPPSAQLSALAPNQISAAATTGQTPATPYTATASPNAVSQPPVTGSQTISAEMPPVTVQGNVAQSNAAAAQPSVQATTNQAGATGQSSASSASQSPQAAVPTGAASSLSYSASTSYKAPIYPDSSAPQQSNTITARVIGQESNGETVLRSSIGTIRLFTASPAPLDSTLQLQLVPAQQNTTQPATTSGASAAQTITSQPSPTLTLQVAAQLAHEWPALEDSIEQLRQDNSQLLQSVASRVPNTRSELVNSVLFFLSALQSGDIRQWLGNQASQRMEQNQPMNFQQLSGDFAALRVAATESPDQPWQMLMIPLMHEDEMHQLQMFIRKDGGGKEESKHEEETRFVVDLQLSELGRLQIDGLVHGNEKQPRFDLVIRSQQPLEQQVQTDIQQLFQDAIDISGYVGQCRFCSGAQHILHPLEEIQQAEANPGEHSILA